MSVPLLFNKVFDGVHKNLAAQPPIRQKLVNYALKVARERNHRAEYSQPVSAWLQWKYAFLDKLVLSKIRAKISPTLSMMTAGGAATSPRVLEFFEDIGIPIMEGYGLTETAPMVTASGLTWDKRRLGCVGVPLRGVDVRIVNPDTLQEVPADNDGEIVCSGPNVMLGYHNNEKANAEVFTQIEKIGGEKSKAIYFRTGDQGRMVEGRFLKITGRMKEQFKLENGKYVVPTPCEDVLLRGPFIQQVFLSGANRLYTSVLVVPNYLELWTYAVKNKKQQLREDLLPFFPKNSEDRCGPLDLTAAFAPFETTVAGDKKDYGKEVLNPLETVKLFSNAEFVHLVTEELLRHGHNLKPFEQPRRWIPILHPFSPENNMLTPKMSVRRTAVNKVYATLIDTMHASDKTDDLASKAQQTQTVRGYALTFPHSKEE